MGARDASTSAAGRDDAGRMADAADRTGAARQAGPACPDARREAAAGESAATAASSARQACPESSGAAAPDSLAVARDGPGRLDGLLRRAAPDARRRAAVPRAA